MSTKNVNTNRLTVNIIKQAKPDSDPAPAPSVATSVIKQVPFQTYAAPQQYTRRDIIALERDNASEEVQVTPREQFKDDLQFHTPAGVLQYDEEEEMPNTSVMKSARDDEEEMAMAKEMAEYEALGIRSMIRNGRVEIINPRTGRYVDPNKAIGKKIIADAKNYYGQ
jgi:hypothetical protein